MRIIKPPDIPPASFHALEQMGEDPVRILLSGPLNFGAIVPVGGIEILRPHVDQWLHWKARCREVWARVATWSAILAAIFSFLGLLK